MVGDSNKNKAPKTLKDIFLELANPDENGFSREVSIEELAAIDSRFITRNGGDWCRSDAFPDYEVRRIKKSNKIVAVKLDGMAKHKISRAINPKIKEAIRKLPCVVLAHTSQVEVDHKDGKYDDRRIDSIDSQKESDFQPLSRAANLAKRQHCKTCKEDQSRFDAKRLGYSESFLTGDAQTRSCLGCYWYDPKKFNEEISRDYKKNR